MWQYAKPHKRVHEEARSSSCQSPRESPSYMIEEHQIDTDTYLMYVVLPVNMSLGRELDRRSIVKAISWALVAPFIQTNDAVTQAPASQAQTSTQSGLDLVKRVLGTYEGLKKRGVLPPYDKQGKVRLNSDIEIAVAQVQDPEIPSGGYKISVSNELYSEDTSTINYKRTLDIYVNTGFSVTRFDEGYSQNRKQGRSSDDFTLNQSFQIEGNRLLVRTGKGLPYQITNMFDGKIPNEYGELAKLVISDWQQRAKSP